MDGKTWQTSSRAKSFRCEMKIAVLIAVLLATLGSYFLLLDEDIEASQQFAVNVKKKSLRRLLTLRDSQSVSERLKEIGFAETRDIEGFRIHQLSMMLLSSFSVLLTSLLSGKQWMVSLIASLIAGVIGYLFQDRKLSKKVKNHRELIESEFPAIVEMMTLSLSAGETPVSAMSRIANRASGPLSQEFTEVINAVKAGSPFHIALDELGRRMKSTHIRRFVDAMITAMLRGAPLIEVLQRHAQVAREADRNRIMSAAGKAEISMMVPVVFLILPISILFALWPSLSNLNLFLA